MNDNNENIVRQSYDGFDFDCRLFADKLLHSGNFFDAIVAVTGEGLFTGHLLSYYLNIPEIWTIGVDKKDEDRPLLFMPNPMVLSGKKTLIVDFVAKTGSTLSQVKRLLSPRVYPDTKLMTAAVFIYQDTEIIPDLYLKRLDENLEFVSPWIVKVQDTVGGIFE